MTTALPSPKEIARLPADGGPDFNRLIHEKSPYLLQHARNPVAWYPWGEAAFRHAREADLPVLLSVGYATCHWCHVMERESFEDPEVAALMNRHFVCIKVDREERPDIDHVYMSAVQALTGHGGWPMTVFMTPDRSPFFAGTYFPKTGRGGRPGMMELLPRVGRLWRERRDDLIQDAERIVRHLQGAAETPSEGALDAALLKAAREQIAGMYDPEHGGFGRAPKFPMPYMLTFLLRSWKRTGDNETLAMVEHTLTAMRRGGMFDQIGFGFHRYSTDPGWLLPHFEKMLYDQALLTLAYVEAWQATGDPRYARIAREILTYVRRDMTAPEGGFHSAEDADSEGEEGRFYLWEPEEIQAVLGAEDARLFCDVFNIRPGGNFREEATGRPTGKSIPHRTADLADLADSHGMAADAFRERIDGMRARLFAVRKERIHPLKDDKVLTDWNGLMIAAMARAGRALGEESYVEAASRAADFALTTLRRPDGRLCKRWRAGEAGLPAHLDDYAFLAWGLLELYEARFDANHLRAAIALTERMVALFWDHSDAGFFMTAADAEPLPLRGKESHDGAIPSGNAVAALNLLRLHRLTGSDAWREKGEALLTRFSGLLNRNPGGYCQMLGAVDFLVGPATEVVITGTPGRPDLARMVAAVRETFSPGMTVLFRPDGADDAGITELAPHIRTHQSVNGRATAYICRDFTCSAPETGPAAVRRMLHGG